MSTRPFGAQTIRSSRVGGNEHPVAEPLRRTTRKIQPREAFVTRPFRSLSILSFSALLFLAGHRTNAAEPVHVTIATQNVAAEAPLFIAMDKGYYKQEGLDVEFEYPGNASTITVLVSTGRADVLAGSVSPALWNAVARGVPLKIVLPIGEVNSRRNTGFTSAISLVISKQDADAGKIKTYADLKGKTIGVPGFGLSNDIVVDHALKRAGLTRHDVDVKEISFPDMLVALSNGAIDVGAENEPFVTQGVQKGIAERWKNAAEINPGQVVAVVAYGPSLVEKGADVGNRLAIALTRAARDYNDAFGPKHLNTDQVIGILTKYTTLKDPALYRQISWNYLDPNCRVNVEALKSDLDWYAQNGYVPQKPDLNQTIDPSYCAAALKALGRYNAR
jgi:NitT/TauT family transport system substrate-binding protein